VREKRNFARRSYVYLCGGRDQKTKRHYEADQAAVEQSNVVWRMRDAIWRNFHPRTRAGNSRGQFRHFLMVVRPPSPAILRCDGRRRRPEFRPSIAGRRVYVASAVRPSL
jgi:hypothetical protein